MSIHDNTAEAEVGTDGAIVRALRSREARRGPAERPDSEVVSGCEERVFLFNTEPRQLVFGSFKNLISKVSEVSISRYKR